MSSSQVPSNTAPMLSWGARHPPTPQCIPFCEETASASPFESHSTNFLSSDLLDLSLCLHPSPLTVAFDGELVGYKELFLFISHSLSNQ